MIESASSRPGIDSSTSTIRISDVVEHAADRARRATPSSVPTTRPTVTAMSAPESEWIAP